MAIQDPTSPMHRFCQGDLLSGDGVAAPDAGSIGRPDGPALRWQAVFSTEAAIYATAIVYLLLHRPL